jgi:ketosteroid isomerase-like protein
MKSQNLLVCAALTAVIASLAACNKPASPAAPASAADVGKIADAVKADADQLVADFNSRDAVKSVAHDAPGMVGMVHGTPNVVGADQDLAQTKQQVADPALKLVVGDETVDVAQSGDLAVYRSTYAWTFTDPATKKPKTEVGNWLIGYKKQPDGTWKIAWNVVSDAPAPIAAKAG